MSHTHRTSTNGSVSPEFRTNDQLLDALTGGGCEADATVMCMVAERIAISAETAGTADPAQILLAVRQTILALQRAVGDLVTGYGHRRLKKPERQAELARTLAAMEATGADLLILADWV